MTGQKIVLALCVLALYTHGSFSATVPKARHHRMKPFSHTPDVEHLKEGGEGSAGPYCPAALDILPCSCFAENATRVYLDCNRVNSEQLANVFQQDFPVQSMTQLYITNSSEPLILDFSMNCVSFAGIVIVDTGLLEIHEEFLSSSYERLYYLVIDNVELASEVFPFSSLPEFHLLYELEMVSAGLNILPTISSPSLVDLYFDKNDIDTIEPGTFNTPNLSYLDLTWNKITELGEGTIPLYNNFYGFYINTLETLQSGAFYKATDDARINYYGLDSGNLTELQPASFLVPATSVDVEIFVSYNQIQEIQTGAFQVDGNFSGYLYIGLQGNQLTVIDESVFGPLMGYDTRLGFGDNPLLCGCDIAWLVTNPIWRQKVSLDTTCADGSYFDQLDPQVYAEQCMN